MGVAAKKEEHKEETVKEATELEGEWSAGSHGRKGPIRRGMESVGGVARSRWTGALGRDDEVVGSNKRKRPVEKQKIEKPPGV